MSSPKQFKVICEENICRSLRPLGQGHQVHTPFNGGAGGGGVFMETQEPFCHETSSEPTTVWMISTTEPLLQSQVMQMSVDLQVTMNPVMPHTWLVSACKP